MSKNTVPPGTKLPKGAFYDKSGKLRFPHNPPITKVIRL